MNNQQPTTMQENDPNNFDDVEDDDDDSISFKYRKRLIALRNASIRNKHCADCMCAETEWVSINLGIFLCINCSGIHRSLGTHLSKVRSIQLDEWDRESYNQMTRIGNYKSNVFWECNVLPFEKPLSDDTLTFRKEYIMKKYAKAAFAPLNWDDQNSENDDNNIDFGLKRNFAIDKIHHTGWIVKQGIKTKNWKKRFAVLRGSTFAYFKAMNSPCPQGQIALDASTIVVFADSSSLGKRNCFSIVTKNRTYYMYCEEEDRVNSWVYSLRASIYYIHLREIYKSVDAFISEDNNNDKHELQLDNVNQATDLFKQGYLKRQEGGTFTSALRNKYFQLKNCHLLIFNTEDEANGGSEPLETVSLKDAILLSTADFKAKKEQYFYSLNLNAQYKQYQLYADTEEDWKEWAQILDHCITVLNEERKVQRRGQEIHDLVLQQIYDEKLKTQGRNADNSNNNGKSQNYSPHSPYNFSLTSFHRSQPLDDETRKQVSELSSRFYSSLRNQ